MAWSKAYEARASTFFTTIKIMPKRGQEEAGFSCIEAIAHTKAPTVSVGNQKMAKRNTGPLRWRTAHRMVFRFAIAIFAASMVIGHSTILDILAVILLAAAIVLFAAAHKCFSSRASAKISPLLTSGDHRQLGCRWVSLLPSAPFNARAARSVSLHPSLARFE
jgi:hypothetical protein